MRHPRMDPFEGAAMGEVLVASGTSTFLFVVPPVMGFPSRTKSCSALLNLCCPLAIHTAPSTHLDPFRRRTRHVRRASRRNSIPCFLISATPASRVHRHLRFAG